LKTRRGKTEKYLSKLQKVNLEAQADPIPETEDREMKDLTAVAEMTDAKGNPEGEDRKNVIATDPKEVQAIDRRDVQVTGVINVQAEDRKEDRITEETADRMIVRKEKLINDVKTGMKTENQQNLKMKAGNRTGKIKKTVNRGKAIPIILFIQRKAESKRLKIQFN